MTTILGYVDDKTKDVYMAADSQSSLNNRTAYGFKKIRRCGPDGNQFLLGIAGEAALNSRAVKAVSMIQPIGDLQSFADHVAVTITHQAMDDHITCDDRMNGYCLLGYNGNLWTISHMIAYRHEEDMAAIGSGSDYALGALVSLRSALVNDVTYAMFDAVDIACRFDINSGGEIVIEKLEAVK